MRLVRLAGSLAASVAVVALAVGLALESRPPVDSASEPAPLRALPEERVRVQVLNGGGVAGMAREATRVLREAGFDVVDFGNASSFDPARPSSVVDRVGRADVAAAVARTLGIDNVLSDPDPNLYVEVTVVLGSGWTTPERSTDEGEAAVARPWWDPRAWLDR